MQDLAVQEQRAKPQPERRVGRGGAAHKVAPGVKPSLPLQAERRTGQQEKPRQPDLDPVGHAAANQRRRHGKAQARGLDAIVVAQHGQQRGQPHHIQPGTIILGHHAATAPKAETPSTLSAPMMQPASSTPPMQARTLDLKSMSKRLAASVPVDLA